MKNLLIKIMYLPANIFDRCLSKFARVIWEMSEYYDIPLGRFAPHVFGWMVGCKRERIN